MSVIRHPMGDELGEVEDQAGGREPVPALSGRRGLGVGTQGCGEYALPWAQIFRPRWGEQLDSGLPRDRDHSVLDWRFWILDCRGCRGGRWSG